MVELPLLLFDSTAVLHMAHCAFTDTVPKTIQPNANRINAIFMPFIVYKNTYKLFRKPNFIRNFSFRDLKSDGFNWQRSHIWLADHAERLLLVLALSYWVVIALGQRLPVPRSGRTARWSAFHRGKAALNTFFRPTIAPLLPLPPPSFISCVVQ